MDLSEQVKEFRVLQKTHRIRVADFCRERTLDYYEMAEALKKDKFLSVSGHGKGKRGLVLPNLKESSINGQ